MEWLLERLVMELLAVVLPLALMRLFDWLRARNGAQSEGRPLALA